MKIQTPLPLAFPLFLRFNVVHSFSYSVQSLSTSNSLHTLLHPSLTILTNANRPFILSPKKQQSLFSSLGKIDGDDASTKPSKCPVTKFSNKIMAQLTTVDAYFTNRFLRLIQHLPALSSLFLFGFISSVSMMGKQALSDSSLSTTSSSLLTVLAQYVGPTSNAALAQMFPTFVTPAPLVFVIWPIIAILQSLTLSLSILFPLQDEFLNGNELAALTTANLLSITWLVVSSMATSSLPLGCVLTLPLVPFIISNPLRNKPRYILPAFEVYSSFTTLAAFLAVAIELQHGGRIPWIGNVSGEISALTFLFLYSASSLAVMKKSLAKRIVNVVALGGILYQRWITQVGRGGIQAFPELVVSLSFWGTVGCFGWAFSELMPGKKKEVEKK